MDGSSDEGVASEASDISVERKHQQFRDQQEIKDLFSKIALMRLRDTLSEKEKDSLSETDLLSKTAPMRLRDTLSEKEKAPMRLRGTSPMRLRAPMRLRDSLSETDLLSKTAPMRLRDSLSEKDKAPMRLRDSLSETGTGHLKQGTGHLKQGTGHLKQGTGHLKQEMKHLKQGISEYLDCYQDDRMQDLPEECALQSLEYLDCAHLVCHSNPERSLHCRNVYIDIEGSDLYSRMLSISKKMEKYKSDDPSCHVCLRLHGIYKIIKEVKESDEDVNIAYEDGDTLLHYSLQKNYPILAALLLHKGADLTQRNKSFRRPIEIIAKEEVPFAKDFVEQVIYRIISRDKESLLKIVCLTLCQEIKTKKFVIIAYQSGSAVSTEFMINGLEIFWRSFYGADDEGLVVSNYSKDVGIAHSLPRIPSQVVNKLFSQHSNLTMVSPSLLKSSGYASDCHRIQKMPCIVLYCRSKGYRPIGEEVFQKEICGLKTDVREGYAELGSLQIGSPVNNMDMPVSEQKTGTIGGFVEHNQTTYFITCSHVLYTPEELESGRLKPGVKVFSPTLNDHCGTVKQATFIHGEPNNVSIDAALIEISDQITTSNSVPEIPDVQMKMAGYDKRDPPVFDSGDVLLDIPGHCRRNHVVKYGDTTKFTSGTFALEQSHVRFENVQLSAKGKTVKSFRMFHQYEIYSTTTKDFFLPGDSGSFVYILMQNNENDLRCIGMAIGQSSHGSCIVTPIKYVLDAFGLPYQLKKFSTRSPAAVTSNEPADKIDMILSIVLQNQAKLERIDGRVAALEGKSEEEMET